MYLVVGLGNPGRKYEKTRHNIGFLIVDRLADRLGETLTYRQFGALVSRAQIKNEACVLAKPQGFMNLSGQPVVSLKGFYKTDLESILVVHDDLDLPFGTVRLKAGGGHGGHNGLRDIQAKVGANGFLRVRVGVSRPPTGHDVAGYVLGRWSATENEQLDAMCEKAMNAVEDILALGISAAMNRHNTKKSSL